MVRISDLSSLFSLKLLDEEIYLFFSTQVISMLFPWSKFFPEYMTRRLINHMSVLERLMEDDNSTRSFVKQMINTLRLVENTYITNTKRKLIVVGHSLGKKDD